MARGEARLLGEAGLLWPAEKPGFLEKPGFCGPRRSPASWRSRASVARGEARLLGEAGLLWPAEKPGFLEKPGFCGPRRSPASWRSRASVARGEARLLGEAGLLWPAEKPGFCGPRRSPASPRSRASSWRGIIVSQLLDRREDRIRRMFNRIAPRYDLLNHLLSLNIDRSCAPTYHVPGAADRYLSHPRRLHGYRRPGPGLRLCCCGPLTDPRRLTSAGTCWCEPCRK